jgi:predicted dinucleotide-binding enzyme
VKTGFAEYLVGRTVVLAMETNVRTIGFIGSGNIGSQLARLAIRNGYDVVMSNSRGPETLVDLVDELGDRARAATPDEAAEAGDVVVVSVPLKAIDAVPVAPLKGKTVIDTNNYYPERDGTIPELDDESTTTSELLQQRLSGSQVVKAFNNIYADHLTSKATPSGAPGRRALPITGDDDGAKRTVASLIDQFGFDVVDAGPLAEGWRFQRDTPAYGPEYDADQVREGLEQAKRYSDMA